MHTFSGARDMKEAGTHMEVHFPSEEIMYA